MDSGRAVGYCSTDGKARQQERWKDFDRIFAAGILSASAPHPQILAVTLKVTGSKEVWHGAYVDWILAGITCVVSRHARDERPVAVSLLSMATFTVPPATRMSLVVRIGGAPEECRENGGEA